VEDVARNFSRRFYKSKAWRDTREYILKRDKYLCQDCREPAEEVHHIVKLTPENINDMTIALGENNLVSLCRNCHKKKHVKDRGEKTDAGDGYEFDANGYMVKAPL